MSYRARLIAADDQSTPTSKGNGEKPVRDSTSQEHEKVVIDPSKGGAVSPKAQKQSKALEVPQGRWVWDGLAKILEVDLFSPAWEVRHGAAIALRELLKLQGKYGGMQGPLFRLLYVCKLTFRVIHSRSELGGQSPSARKVVQRPCREVSLHFRAR